MQQVPHRDYNSAVTCQPRCYLARSAQCIWADTHYCI